MKENSPMRLPLFSLWMGAVGSLCLLSCNRSAMLSSPQENSKAHTYYVSATGDDANNGTRDAPFRSVNAGLAKTAPGDTVLVRGGIYPEKVVFSKSGKADRPITLMAYPGERAFIDGSTLSISGQEALVTIRDAGYFSIRGFDICNYTTQAAGVDINGIIIQGGSQNISVKSNRIYNIANNASPQNGRSGHGILVIGNTDHAIRNIVVDGNEIHDCKTGYSENLTINGYVDGFAVTNNRVYNGENIGIDAAGGYAANKVPALNYARNGVISGNEVFNIDGMTNPIAAFSGGHHGAIGIYVDGARNIILERNRVYDSDRGIGIVSETNGFPTEGCIVRNNFIYNCWLTGIYLGGYPGYTGGGTKNCHVVNNTLFKNNRTASYYNEIEGEIRVTENCFDNTIRNNIVYGRDKDVFVHKYSGTGSGNSIDNNFYFTTGTPIWIWGQVNDSLITDFAKWQSVSNQDSRSINGIDPLLVSTALPDLHIRPSSPCVNAGPVISAAVNGEKDIDNRDRITNNKICLGAQQVQ